MPPQVKDEKYKIPRPLAEALLEYLARRPFNEVFHFINALQTLEKIEQTPEPPPGVTAAP